MISDLSKELELLLELNRIFKDVPVAPKVFENSSNKKQIQKETTNAP